MKKHTPIEFEDLKAALSPEEMKYIADGARRFVGPEEPEEKKPKRVDGTKES